MSVDVTATVTIDRRVDDVAAYAGDPSNAPTWYRRISSAEWETGPPIAAGSRIAFRARFLGRDLVYTYEIMEYVPGERLTMSTAEGPFPMTTTYTWARNGDGGTTMTLRNHGRPSGFSRLAAPFVAMAMKRAMNQDLRELRRQLELR